VVVAVVFEDWGLCSVYVFRAMSWKSEVMVPWKGVNQFTPRAQSDWRSKRVDSSDGAMA